eukprot:snap_masked-scaffold_39-processed-gene-2.30-mRNA-1 protein AED:1.00 eAED:1.00 QI:0/-1/0/0/-1/1/1/0/102
MDKEFVVFGRSSYKISDFKEENNTLYYKERLVVPKENTATLFRKVHEEDIRTNHLAVDRTSQIIKKLYFWSGLQRDVCSFIKEYTVYRRENKFTKPVEKSGR